MASRIQGITVEIGGDTTKLSKALESVNKSIKGTQSGLKDVNKLLKLDPSNTELVVQKQKMLKDAIEATKEKLATLKTAAQQANEQLANGEITQQQYDALQREIVETEQNLRSLQDQAATTNATLAKIDEAGEKLQNIGSSVENVGKKFLPVTAAVTGLGTAAVKTAADFDSEMSKVSAISGATGDDFDQLRAKAREMGAKTKFSASEAASAMEYMAMAGWKTGDMLNGIEGIMNLAAASGEDLATTSDIVTDALTAFGLSAADSGHFADILAAASSNANTNVSMMGETFKYCAPIAGALGFSAEDTAEAIGLMANSGIKASQAGTSLRTIMNNLSGEVTFVGKNIGEVTIATSNADGSMRSLNDILADCRVAFSGLSESEKAANAEALVGKNAMSGFLALMNSSETDINKLRGAIENCDGASESMAETMQDNLNGQLTILKSQLEELAISFGDILMPTIRKIVSAVQQFVDKLNSMDESTRETIIKIGLLAASIGPLLIVLGKTISTVGTAMRGFSSLAKGVRLLITHVGSASGVFSKLGVVLGGLSGPVVAVVAVIGTLVAAFMNLWNTNEEFRTAITGIWNDIVSKVKGFCDQLTQRINGLGFDFKDVTEVLKAVWDGFCQVLAPLFEGAFQNIATILGVVLDTLLGLFQCVLRQLERCMGSGERYLLQHLGRCEVCIFHNAHRIKERTGCVPWSVRYGLADGLGQYQELLRDRVEWNQQLLFKHSFCYPECGNDCVHCSFELLYDCPYEYPDDFQHHLDCHFYSSFFRAEYDPYHSDNCVDGNLDRDLYGHEHHQHHHHFGVEWHLQHHETSAGCVQISV